MKLKTCSFCKKETFIYKNATIDGVRVRSCKSCVFNISTTKPIKKVSDKQTKLNKEYAVLRLKHLTKFPLCQAALPGCTNYATDIHHVEGRGINTTNADTFKSICRSCHTSVHAQLSREERNELGL